MIAQLPTRRPRFLDPMAVKEEFWPQVRFYKEQQEVIYSVVDNPITVVPAGNKLGKDYACGFIVPYFAISAWKLGKTFKIITTSVTERHLKVMWGEIGGFMSTSKHKLIWSPDNPNAPFVLNFQEIRLAREASAKNPKNYAMGVVTGPQAEGLAGHHADETLLIGDEASGLSDEVKKMGEGWAKRMLFIGNPNACSNFFYHMVKAGSVLAA